MTYLNVIIWFFSSLFTSSESIRKAISGWKEVEAAEKSLWEKKDRI